MGGVRIRQTRTYPHPASPLEGEGSAKPFAIAGTLYYIIASLPEPGLSQPHVHRHAASLEPGFSLLRLSAAERLAGAGLIAGLLWLLVWWAL